MKVEMVGGLDGWMDGLKEKGKRETTTGPRESFRHRFT